MCGFMTDRKETDFSINKIRLKIRKMRKVEKLYQNIIHILKIINKMLTFFFLSTSLEVGIYLYF